MKNLDDWARRWNIPPQAVEDLRRVFGVNEPLPGIARGTEAVAQQQIRLQAPKHGVRLWRNNNGACYDQDGRLVRYGLANDSKQLSDKIKSSDLIGITPYTVRPDDTGKIIGVFTSIEVKAPGWVFNNTKREKAQAAWLQLVQSLGGFAQFATGPGDIWHD